MRLFSHRASSSLATLLLLALGLQGCTTEDPGEGAAGAAGAPAGQGGSCGSQAGGTQAGASGAGQGGSEAGQGGSAGQGGAGGKAGEAGAAGQGGSSAGSGGSAAGASGAGGEGAGGQAGEAGAAGAGAAGAAGSGAAGAGGEQAASGLAAYGPAAAKIDDGGELAPFNLDGIPPFSDGIVDVTLTNEGAAPLQIESVTITPIEPTLDGEWRLSQAGSTGYKPITVENVSLEPTKSTSFAGYFSPYASGVRKAKVEVKHQGGKVFSFTVVGRGRDNAEFSPKVSASLEVLYGDPAADLLTGGMVSGPDGTVWASANATQWKDNFSQNIVVYSVKPDGTLGWAKLWNEPHDQRQPDPGQNAESGGGADCIAADATHLYLVGRRSLSSSNSLFQTLVFKVDKATGAIAWARGISMTTTAEPKVGADSSEAYAVDARHADRILVTGSGGNAQAASGFVTLFALDKSTGDMIFDQLIEVVPGSQDRGQAIVSDGAGNAYIGGSSAGGGLLLRVTGVDTAAPKLDWVKKVALGVGGNINSLDLDPGGDVYASLDRRGATTFLSMARLSKAGQLVWGKTWDDQNAGDNNNSYVVRHNDGKVYFGGRVAINPFDTQAADGFLMAASGADGAYQWASFYYTGKGAEELVEHRVKGIGFGPSGDARTLLQSYTNSLNFDHYWGFWYQAPDYTKELPAGDGSKRYADYAPALSDVPEASISDAPKATIHPIDTAALWVDPQPTAALSPLKPRQGNGGDGSSLIQQIKLAP